jgi:hypothetical protein
MSIAFWVWVIGAALYLATWFMNEKSPRAQIAELSKWAFIIGLVFWLWGMK